ncbi:MAG: MFS transporter [Bryobacteraceae bacterium]|nr:MFS transporter [Bryobacteraceae bacterium]
MKPHRWAVVALLVAGVVINYVDRGNLSVAAVDVMQDLHIKPGAMGVLLSSFFWTYALFQLPCGYFLDRFGLKRTYAIAFLLWSLSSAAIGFAQTFEQVLILRLILGVGEAVVTPASIAFIRTNFAEHEQGLPTAVFVGGMMMGPAIGTLFGGLLLETVGWRSLFIWTGLAACVWVVPWMLIVREPPARDSIETKAPVPAVLASLLHWRLFWCVSIGAVFYSYFWYFCLNWLPSYFLLAWKLSPSQMAVATAVPLAFMVVLSLSSGRVGEHIQQRLPVGIDSICRDDVAGEGDASIQGVENGNQDAIRIKGSGKVTLAFGDGREGSAGLPCWSSPGQIVLRPEKE